MALLLRSRPVYLRTRGTQVMPRAPGTAPKALGIFVCSRECQGLARLSDAGGPGEGKTKAGFLPVGKHPTRASAAKAHMSEKAGPVRALRRWRPKIAVMQR